MGSEVRSGDLEKGSSSNVGGEGARVDTATSAPSHVPSSSYSPAPAVPPPFHALKEKYSLKIEVFSKFRDRFQFPEVTKARLPRKGENACTIAHGASSLPKPCTRAAYV